MPFVNFTDALAEGKSQRDPCLRFFLSDRTAVTRATCLLTTTVENFIYFEDKSREAQMARHDWLLLSPCMYACIHLETVSCIPLTEANLFLVFNLSIKLSERFFLFIHYPPDDTGK